MNPTGAPMAWAEIEATDAESIPGDLDALAAGCAYRAAAMAAGMGMSTRSLERRILALFGVTPKTWLLRRRMARARTLLRQGHRIQQVALVLGFKQTSHFCRVFRSHHGMTASSFLSGLAGQSNGSRNSITDFRIPRMDSFVSPTITPDNT